jgi:integrase
LLFAAVHGKPRLNVGTDEGTAMAKATDKLTALRVKREQRAGRHHDGSGLYLHVGKTGAKSWVLRFMLDGRRHDMGLGNIDTVTLAEARARALEARKLKAGGIDPLGAKRASRAAARAAQAKSVTFAECAEAYIRDKRSGWRSIKHAKQWETTLAEFAMPTLGELPVSAIDTGLVLKVLRPLWDTKTETASRIRTRIELILDWARVSGYRDGENPARWRGHLDKLLPARGKVQKVEHHAALPYRDIPAFMAELRKLDGTAARALEFTILTAARTGEVRGASTAEFDRGAGVWTVPGSRMKSGREHRVPLSAPALALVDDVVAHTAVNAMGRTLAKLRPGLTVHGMRSTFRDWAAETTSFPNHVVEQALAHAIPSAVEASYRRGDLMDKRRELMSAWADFCCRI